MHSTRNDSDEERKHDLNALKHALKHLKQLNWAGLVA